MNRLLFWSKRKKTIKNFPALIRPQVHCQPTSSVFSTETLLPDYLCTLPQTFYSFISIHMHACVSIWVCIYVVCEYFHPVRFYKSYFINTMVKVTFYTRQHIVDTVLCQYVELLLSFSWLYSNPLYGLSYFTGQFPNWLAFRRFSIFLQLKTMLQWIKSVPTYLG